MMTGNSNSTGTEIGRQKSFISRADIDAHIFARLIAKHYVASGLSFRRFANLHRVSLYKLMRVLDGSAHTLSFDEALRFSRGLHISLDRLEENNV